jgi:hypothetical protein
MDTLYVCLFVLFVCFYLFKNNNNCYVVVKHELAVAMV